MRISIISAVANDNVIGYNNMLPWGNIPADMGHFKAITMGKAVIMGFKTYKSIGKPLKGRVNIILTNNNMMKNLSECIFVNSSEEALKEAEKTGSDEVMIIGGASVYNLFILKADRIYLTKIDGKFTGDTYFPKINMLEWQEVEKEKINAGEKNKYNLEFITYERKK
ncbi:MAG: dihydrofolate reductase [Patescibacteria group bacterium]